MRTTLNLDDSLIEAARSATGEQEKTKLIHLGAASAAHGKRQRSDLPRSEAAHQRPAPRRAGVNGSGGRGEGARRYVGVD
ncbi:MAG: type II toxin-antitoxin system VapB family antitoxin [Chthoniobacterales bacterium]